MTIAGPFFMFPDVDLLAPNAVSRVDVTRLANGGFAVIGDQSGHINGAIYDAAGNIIQNFSDVLGTDGAIAQLSGDRLVIVSETASSVQFEILDAVTGAQVLATTTANSGVGQNADVATLPGGSFVLAYQAAGVGTDSNIQLEFWTSAGVYQQTVFVDTSLAADTDVSVAALADGRIAVAWTRTDSIGETDLWFAIYAADGTEVKSPALLDGAFDVNRNASVAASGDGFAIAYETRALAPFPSARIDIFLRQFNSSGIEQSNTRVTNTAFDDTGILDNLDHTDPYLAYAPDGNLAVGYTDELGDTHFAIVKDAAVISEIQTGAGNSNQQSNTAVAFFGVGQLASFHADDILGVRGEHWYGSRDVVGEDFGEIYQGDDFVDIINGRGGDDTLDGGGGNDEVKGDDGFDIVRGGEGDDMVDGAGDTGTMVAPMSSMVTPAAIGYSGVVEPTGWTAVPVTTKCLAVTTTIPTSLTAFSTRSLRPLAVEPTLSNRLSPLAWEPSRKTWR